MTEDNLDDAANLATEVLWNEDGSYPRIIVLTGRDAAELFHIRCIACEAAKLSVYHDLSPFKAGVFRVGAHDELPVTDPKRLVWLDITDGEGDGDGDGEGDSGLGPRLVKRIADESEGRVLITATEAVKDKLPRVSALSKQPITKGRIYVVKSNGVKPVEETKGGEGSAAIADALSSIRDKVHASFSSGSAMTMLQLSDMVAKAGFDFTVVHIAQTEQWFEVWAFKAESAMYIVVVFDRHYKVKFDETVIQSMLEIKIKVFQNEK